MSVTLYHNPRCSKSRAVLGLLEERGITPHVIAYLDTPPSADELRHLLRLLGKAPRDILRQKEAREEGIADLDGDTLIEAMAAHPRALERPILVNEDRAVIGRPPEAIFDIL